MSKTTRAHVLSDFTDAGTGERFTAGKSVDIETGSFGNYEAAGLVRAVGEKPADDGKTKPAA